MQIEKRENRKFGVVQNDQEDNRTMITAATTISSERMSTQNGSIQIEQEKAKRARKSMYRKGGIQTKAHTRAYQLVANEPIVFRGRFAVPVDPVLEDSVAPPVRHNFTLSRGVGDRRRQRGEELTR